MINHIKSECSNLVHKEYKTRKNFVGKVICWKLYKKIKFELTNNPESIQENETHELVWDFEIQMDHLISAIPPNLAVVKKKIKEIKRELAVLADHTIKLKESELKDKFLDLTREQKKTMEHEGDSDTNYNWCTWNNPPDT